MVQTRQKSKRATSKSSQSHPQRPKRHFTANDDNPRPAKVARTDNGQSPKTFFTGRHGTIDRMRRSPEPLLEESTRSKNTKGAWKRRNTTIVEHVTAQLQPATTWPRFALAQVDSLDRTWPDSPIEYASSKRRRSSFYRTRFRDVGRMIRRYTKVRRHPLDVDHS